MSRSTKTNEKYDNSAFYKAQDHWIEHKDEESWQIMWQEMYNACRSRMKLFAKKAPHCIPDLEEVALETTIMIMKRYHKKPLKIDNLSNYVYLPCFGTLYDPKRKARETKEGYLEFGDVTERATPDAVYSSFEDDLIDRLTEEGY